MPYERYAILNPSTGEQELVNVRISMDGFTDWLSARAELAEAGFPDRPPDVDTPMMRLWVKHPGEDGHPYFESKRSAKLLADDVTTYPVYVAKWHSADLTVLLKLEVDHGKWATVMVASGPAADAVPWPDWMEKHEDHYAGARTALPTTRTAMVWADVEHVLQAIADINDWPSDEPRVSNYFDLLAMDQEVELAEADVARGFPNPLPEARG